jgi:2-dehydro-3-deoxyphosphooctonate aldolase (KDO 8-P synthase)
LVDVSGLTVGNDRPLTVIAGPCQLESADHAQMIAGRHERGLRRGRRAIRLQGQLRQGQPHLAVGQAGLGLEAGLACCRACEGALGVPVLTDVHCPEQCARPPRSVDVLQIPAFLCRQTDLLLAAGETGAAINVKKGQFLAPWDMANVDRQDRKHRQHGGSC